MVNWYTSTPGAGGGRPGEGEGGGGRGCGGEVGGGEGGGQKLILAQVPSVPGPVPEPHTLVATLVEKVAWMTALLQSLREEAPLNMPARKRRNRTALSAQRGAASEGGRHKGTWTGVDGA